MKFAADHNNSIKNKCSEHGVSPSKCYKRHIEEVDEEVILTEAENREAIIKEHIRIQEQNIRKQAEKLSRDPKDLREKYNRREVG